MVADATRIREDCEYKWGGIYDRLPKAKGTRGQLAGKVPGTGEGKPKGKGKAVTSGGATTAPPEVTPTLAELGIDPKVAARSQRRAKAGRQAHEARADQAVVKAKDVVNAAAAPRTTA